MIRLLTGSLIMVPGIWMGAGVVNILIQLKDEFTSAWVSIVEHTIANGLIMLALLAVIRTLQAYLTLGRVRVILYSRYRTGGADRRVMGLWFREYVPQKVRLGLGVIVVLVILRLLTARFPPKPQGAPFAF